jgi:hypothetical protein
MDGDTSFIYTKWISAVLDSLKDKMERRHNATKGFVTSIMGLQSSGKSTLLNTQYNLRFAVSAGRCTKGIFMLPVILSEELRKEYKDKLHFMLLFDTEGLRAQELGISSENRSKDGEMATACIGIADVTAINSMNFQNSELFDILSIVVNMILRYKKDNTDEMYDAFDVSAVFINQGISDSQYKAIDLGIAVRQKDLNRMTQVALRRLGFPQKRVDVKSFTEVVKTALPEQFIEPLFVDEGNLRRYSFEYVQKAHRLRQLLLESMSKKARSMESITEKITRVYQSIILDNFAFQFRNDEELAAKMQFQEKYNEFKMLMIKQLDDSKHQEPI